MSRKPPQPKMWMPDPGSLTASATTTTSTGGQIGWTPPLRRGQRPPRPPTGNDVTRWAHDLERTWWHYLEELERALLQRRDPPQIHAEHVDGNRGWQATFHLYAEPPGVMQRGATLGEAIRQACTYVAGLMQRYVGSVDMLSERRRYDIVQAMAELRVNAHASADFRSQSAGLHGNTSGIMDFGHAQAHAAYTEGVRILNPAYEALRNSDTTGNFQSLRPILEVSEHGGAGEAHIGAGTAGLPFNLPPGHYRSLGHHHNHREVNTSVYFPMSRAQWTLNGNAAAAQGSQDS